MAKRIRVSAAWFILIGLTFALVAFARSNGIEAQRSDRSVQKFANSTSLPEVVSPIVVTDYAIDKSKFVAMLPPSLQTASSCQNNADQVTSFVPPQESALAHPTNYGQRSYRDADGNRVNNELLVVLHETVGSADSAINTFQVPHYHDSKQVSYHDIIRRDGTVVKIVPIEMRAFGAGNSEFEGAKGIETVKNNPDLAASVNNFAYHISLETPPDTDWDAPVHSGYTEAQYRSLAWLIAQTCTDESRIVTHESIDRGRNRLDPRSFEWYRLSDWLYLYSQPTTFTVYE